jgi:hypothetical protein
MIWGGDRSDAERNLLVLATGQLLSALATKHPDGSASRLQLTQHQFLDVADAVFATVIDNPAWVATRADLPSPLGAALMAVMGSLQQQKLTQVNSATALAAVKAALAAGGEQLAFLQPLPPAGRDGGKIALAAALDAIFEELGGDHVDAQVRWQLARNSTMQALIDIVFSELAKAGADLGHIKALRPALRELAAGRVPLPQLSARLVSDLASAHT